MNSPRRIELTTASGPMPPLPTEGPTTDCVHMDTTGRGLRMGVVGERVRGHGGSLALRQEQGLVGAMSCTCRQVRHCGSRWDGKGGDTN